MTFSVTPNAVLILLALIAAFVLVASWLANCSGYDRGKRHRSATDYNEGHADGLARGKREGEASGYKRGWSEGLAHGTAQPRGERGRFVKRGDR